MVKENKEWFYLIGVLALLAPGLFYFLSPNSQQLNIKEPAIGNIFKLAQIRTNLATLH